MFQSFMLFGLSIFYSLEEEDWAQLKTPQEPSLSLLFKDTWFQ